MYSARQTNVQQMKKD